MIKTEDIVHLPKTENNVSLRHARKTSDPEAHYEGVSGPFEFAELEECSPTLRNIGWTLGNDCPYRCRHCYSMSARRRGANLERWMVYRIIDQLVRVGIQTVNLGGNEPLFTNGMDVKRTLLPQIIRSLTENGITVGLTTSGITLIHLDKSHPEELRLLNDVDISFDSPFEHEHNQNRGAALFKMAKRALEICADYGIDRTIIMAAMTWNFSHRHIDGLVELARKYDAQIRINTLKPVEICHVDVTPDATMFYDSFSYVMSRCDQIDLGEPLLATACAHPAEGCPCGRTSFRIHSITPSGEVPVSPCVYLHEYKVGDLLRDDIFTIINSPQFRAFRRRVANPDHIEGCGDCAHLEVCRGGCAARSYLHHLHETHRRSLFVKDPYCLRECPEMIAKPCYPFPQRPVLPADKILVHRNYLCTWIGKPCREGSGQGRTRAMS